jgi:hypothetical protein
MPVTITHGIDDGPYIIRATNQQSGQADAAFTIPCAAPDLVIGDLELISPTPIETHEAVTFQVVITNSGNLPAIDQFFVSLYFNPDPPPVIGSSTHIPAEYRVAVVAFNGLGAGQSRTVSLTANNGFPITGTHSVYAVVDSDPAPTGLIVERFETNNIAGPLQVVVENEGTSPEDPLPPGETGSLTGTAFIDNSDGQVWPQAMVRVRAIRSSNGEVLEVFEVYTDMAGSYYFAELPVGTYTVTGCFDGDGIEYFTAETGVVISQDEIGHRDLYLGEHACS